jgi:hypothetical protein
MADLIKKLLIILFRHVKACRVLPKLSYIQKNKQPVRLEQQNTEENLCKEFYKGFL